MYPIKLKPIFKDYIWGGTRLRDDFGKDCGFERIAESWELSCHKNGFSVIASGEHSGKTLAEYISFYGKDAVGINCAHFTDFPVLIKLIDAKDNLSVQVHPDNDYALCNECGYGKTEMWYIIDCDEGSEILYGLKTEVTEEEFKSRIQNNSLLDIVKSIPVKKGDAFFIEAGTLHAIGKGIILVEIQQSSDTTYRIYDYERTGTDGKPRELHIEKAVAVTKLSPVRPYPFSDMFKENDEGKRLLSKCDYFTVYFVNVNETAVFNTGKTSFECLLILEGGAELIYGEISLTLVKGESVFIPAACGEYSIRGNFKALQTRID